MKWQSTLIALCVTTSVANAEDRKFCLIGRDSCEYIGLVELHIEKQKLLNHADDGTTFDFGVGLMTKSGFGATIGWRTYDLNEQHFMARGRYRYWLTPMTGLDVSVAPLLAAKLRPGINLQVGVEFADEIGIVVDFDVARRSTNDGMGGSDTVVAASIGVRFSNFTAIPAAIIGIAAAVASGGD